MKNRERTGAEESQGVWYCCGTANVLPGKKYVYSGPMATYCMWHRPIAVYARSARKTFFVFGNAQNSPTISYYLDSARDGVCVTVDDGKTIWELLYNAVLSISHICTGGNPDGERQV